MMELLNNNKSMDFHDLKQFALANFWTRKKVLIMSCSAL